MVYLASMFASFDTSAPYINPALSLLQIFATSTTDYIYIYTSCIKAVPPTSWQCIQRCAERTGVHDFTYIYIYILHIYIYIYILFLAKGRDSADSAAVGATGIIMYSYFGVRGVGWETYGSLETSEKGKGR